MKNNFEFGTPLHIPEEPNSFERPPDEYYDEYFKKIQEQSEAYMKAHERLGIRVAPETYYAEVDRADALEVALAVSDKERDEFELVNVELVQENTRLDIENQKLREKIENLQDELTSAEKIYASLLRRLPSEPSLRNLTTQKMGHVASKLNQ